MSCPGWVALPLTVPTSSVLWMQMGLVPGDLVLPALVAPALGSKPRPSPGGSRPALLPAAADLYVARCGCLCQGGCAPRLPEWDRVLHRVERTPLPGPCPLCPLGPEHPASGSLPCQSGGTGKRGSRLHTWSTCPAAPLPPETAIPPRELMFPRTCRVCAGSSQ